MERQKILVIDDSPENIMTLGSALMDEYELSFASSGIKGIELAQSIIPDLVLLDIMMPEMDGYETCKRIKDDPSLHDIPVIFVTAIGEIESEGIGLALGASDYITKPVNIEIARLRIRNLMERETLRKVAETQRAQLNAQLAQIKLAASVFDYAREGIMITDLNAVICDVNESFTHITGFTREEALGSMPQVLGTFDEREIKVR